MKPNCSDAHHNRLHFIGQNANPLHVAAQPTEVMSMANFMKSFKSDSIPKARNLWAGKAASTSRDATANPVVALVKIL